MLYIDHVLFPVAPEKIDMEIEVDNETVSLVDGSFVTRLGGRGLKKISFDLLLPIAKYPFALYEKDFKSAKYYIEELERIARENKPVWFDVYRTLPDMNKTYLTNVMVVVEKICFTEDAKNGMDMVASIVLREYRTVETRLSKERGEGLYEKREYDYSVPYTYTVKRGDSLWLISKKFFDDGSLYTYLARINSIKKPYTIYTGQIIKLRE